MADDLGVTLKDVQEMEGRLAAFDSAFDAPVEDSDDAPLMAPAQYLEAEDLDPAEQLAEADWQEQGTRRLHQAMQTLDDRSRDILQRRWLTDDKTTLQDLADEYGVSAERIRQLENGAIKKLRTAVMA